MFTTISVTDSVLWQMLNLFVNLLINKLVHGRCVNDVQRNSYTCHSGNQTDVDRHSTLANKFTI